MLNLVEQNIIPHSLGKISSLDKSKTIAIDFDGVIHSYHQGFQGLENAYGDVHPGARKAISKLHESGFKLIVLSSRPAYVIRDWLKKYALDIYFEEITNVKRPASFYIDDHAVEFIKGDKNSWIRALNKILGENN